MPLPTLNPIQVSHDGGNKVNILGIPMVIRIHGRDTGGAVSVVESHDVPGSFATRRVEIKDSRGAR